MDASTKTILRIVAYRFVLAKHQIQVEGISEGTPEYNARLSELNQQYKEWSEADLVAEISTKDFSFLHSKPRPSS